MLFDDFGQGTGHIPELVEKIVVEPCVGFQIGIFLAGLLEGAAHLAHGHQQKF